MERVPRRVSRILAAYRESGAPTAAASLAYFLLMSLFPVLLCVNHVVGGFHSNLRALIEPVAPLLPGPLPGLIFAFLDRAAEGRSPLLFWAALLAAISSGSAGLRTILRVMDGLYHRPAPAPIRRAIQSALLSLLLLLAVYLSVAVILTGNWFFALLRDRLPTRLFSALALGDISRLWCPLRYALLFCAVLLLVLTVYRAGTPRSVPPRRLLAAAALSALAMAACSALFSGVVGMSARYALLYGALASLVTVMVWLYWCGYILLFGAVVTSCL
ncbi:MAG: YhjD/YihY/BrkB family envelope integrity protein [Clostridia bacterium]|nr:YhjD/YihY/BrkB family envelope integrity protein [Clostridia bacterium]